MTGKRRPPVKRLEGHLKLASLLRSLLIIRAVVIALLAIQLYDSNKTSRRVAVHQGNTVAAVVTYRSRIVVFFISSCIAAVGQFFL